MDTQRKTPIKKILIIALILVLGLAAYSYWRWERDTSRLVKARTEKASEISGPAVEVVSTQTPAARVDVCTESKEKLQGLFAYFDRQDYIASYRLKGGTSELFKGLLARLLKKPPYVQRETDSLLQVLQNRAHFFRVLGKKNTLLLRDILLKEGDTLESSFAILYRAMALQDKCKADRPVLHIPLQEIYPYAVFFLNTLGGTSYLMRRESRVRMLTQYYCILILDQANQRRLNNLGLDIRPPLDILMQDMKGAANLTKKDEYIETLKTIRARY
ncbi:MAG: hypothetical protein A3J94_08205 [Syntrophus sp. RIFOXYC2_FULL_54_9]|nr:MAG: hypothetical protein A3J94_08205 [Syntrophus sp. RIFOXYC2_FULL_54_9]HBB17546.1 hypothetical protein [Syntrophus sp. (in: bacteria)]